MKTIIHAVRPVFTWDLLCLARLVVIAWPTLSKKEATPRRTKGMRSQCWIQFNVSLMISSSVYIQNISLLGNKEQNRFSEGFFFLSYVLIPVDVLIRRSIKTCGWPKQSHGFFLSFFELFLHICAKETVGKTLWLVQTVSRFFMFWYRCVNETVCKTLWFSGFFLSFLYVFI